MKINYTLVAFIFLLGWAVVSTYFGYEFYQRFMRVSDNQEVLLQQVQGLRKETQLVLTPKEFRQAMDSSTRIMMKELDLKARHIEQSLKVSSSMGGNLVINNRDTTIYNGIQPIQATSFYHKEKYLTVRGLVLKDSTFLTWGAKDSLNILLYWHREGKFIPAIFGKKVYEGAIKGENPYMKYQINQNIKVQKR